MSICSSVKKRDEHYSNNFKNYLKNLRCLQFFFQRKKNSLPAIIGPPINFGSKGRSDVVDGDKFNEGVLLAASSAYRGNNKIINWIYTRSISIAN